MIWLPLRTSPGMNAREHFAVRAKRVKGEREAVAWSLKGKTRPAIPCSVILTRIKPMGKELDDDNLTSSLKAVRDEVANWLGVDDRDRMTVRYRYAQRRGPWGVSIEFAGPVVGAQHVLEFEE